MNYFTAFNKIKTLSSEIFTNLDSLEKVYMKANLCIDENFLNEIQISKIQDVVASKCNVETIIAEAKSEVVELKHQVEFLVANFTVEIEVHKNETELLKAQIEKLHQENQNLLAKSEKENEKIDKLNSEIGEMRAREVQLTTLPTVEATEPN